MANIYKTVIASKLVRSVSLSNSREHKRLEKSIRRLLQLTEAVKGETITRTSQFKVHLPNLYEKLGTTQPDYKELENDFEVRRDGDFLCFRCNHHIFNKTVLKAIREERANFGYIDPWREKESVCVEFSSPNIAKPFHVGHMRSTILGNILSNMHETAGNSVNRINFLGDWGTQYGLLCLGLERYADVTNMERDPLQELFQVYVKINQDVATECGGENETKSETYQQGLRLFSLLEKGDQEMLSKWNNIKNISVEALGALYQRLGVHFTHVQTESQFHEQTSKVLQILRDKQLLWFDSEGVGYVKTDDDKIQSKVAVVKSDGSSLYLTRDIAAALERLHSMPCDKMLYVVSHDQEDHFRKLTNILQKLEIPWAHRNLDEIHIRFGRVHGMSTRKGEVVFLENVLDELQKRVLASLPKAKSPRLLENSELVAENIAMASLILQDLKSPRQSGYKFSWEKMLNKKEDSGMFVQYCHARLCNLLLGCDCELTDDVDISCLDNDPTLHNLILHLSSYPDVFDLALENSEPHYIARFIFNLCVFINAAYKVCPVKGQKTDLAQARLLTFEASRQVLNNALVLLGITPVKAL